MGCFGNLVLRSARVHHVEGFIIIYIYIQSLSLENERCIWRGSGCSFNTKIS